MKIKKEKSQQRYFDYLLTYTNTINEYSKELENLSKKKKSGEIKLGKRKYVYFSTNKGVTILNRKNDLEMSFTFSHDGENVYFEKDKFHNFIESDLNAQGLGQDFPSNKALRGELFRGYFDENLMSGIIRNSGEGYIISSNELF